MLLLLAAQAALATYSVVVADTATGELGSAGASCVGDLAVSIIQEIVPGVGAVHAQAYINLEGRDAAGQALRDGAAPQEIIDAVTSPGFDDAASYRQYGVVDLSARAAGWTGSDNGVWAADEQGTSGQLTYSVQGNILTSLDVLARSREALLEGGGCDLPERLMLALEAGAREGEGDSRCTGAGIPSDSAYLRVVSADGTERVFLEVVDTAPQDPLVLLREQLDAWRADEPCPPEDTGSGTPTDTTATTTETTGTTTETTGTGTTGGSSSASTAASTGTPEDTDAGAATLGDGGGCGCAVGESHVGGWLALLSGLVGVRRRRTVA